MRPLLLNVLLIPLLAGCVIMDPSPVDSPSPRSTTVRTPVRLNVRVGLDCTPICAFVGTDLRQISKSIIAAYEATGRFVVVPSDQVDFTADIKVKVDREDELLDAGVCNRTFGLVPATWRDRLHMSTTFTGQHGGARWHLDQEADIGYRCHLFLAPFSPFWSEPDMLERQLAGLSLSTIKRADAAGVWKPAFAATKVQAR